MQVPTHVAIRFYAGLFAASILLMSSNQSEAAARSGVASFNSGSHAADSEPGFAVRLAAARATDRLPVSCQEAQAFAAQFGPQEAVREARRRKLSWAQIKRVKSVCFDRSA